MESIEEYLVRARRIESRDLWARLLFFVFLLDISLGREALTGLMLMQQWLGFALLKCCILGWYFAGPVSYKNRHQQWPNFTTTGAVTVCLIGLCAAFDFIACMRLLR